MKTRKASLLHNTYLQILLLLAGVCLLFVCAKMAGTEAYAKENRLKEKFYDYEVKTAPDGSGYVVLKGVREECRENIEKSIVKFNIDWGCIPETLEGLPVREIAADAFRDMKLEGSGDKELSIRIPHTVERLSESCFEDCGIGNIQFDKEEGKREVAHSVYIDNRAFANNPELWGVLLNTADTLFGEEVFDGCAKAPYLCCIMENDEDKERLSEAAAKNNAELVELPGAYEDSPIVHYAETPLTLTPEVRNFFYGESAPEDLFNSFQYDSDAWDFGFPEWQLPCGEVCVWNGFSTMSATSELASKDGRYKVGNLYRDNREKAWSEGVDGYGIGESISIIDNNGCGYQKEQYDEGYAFLLEGDIEPDIYDGYMRYIQICVVNGYAKNEKLYAENGRVKRLLMYVEDKPYAYLEIADTMYPQYFDLPINDIKAAHGVDIHFRFEIQDIYPGTKYEDTCLTGLLLEFMGRRGH